MFRAIARGFLIAGHAGGRAALTPPGRSGPSPSSRPLRAGGITDVLARLMSERLQEALKQPFIVENSAGAAGMIAARSGPQGGHPTATRCSSRRCFSSRWRTSHKTSPSTRTTFTPIPASPRPVRDHRRRAFPGNDASRLHRLCEGEPGQTRFGSAGIGSTTHVAAGLCSRPPASTWFTCPIAASTRLHRPHGRATRRWCWLSGRVKPISNPAS